MNLSKYVFPGYSAGTLKIQFVEALIQFTLLRSREREHLGSFRQTVPKLLKKTQPLFGIQGGNIDYCHGQSIASIAS